MQRRHYFQWNTLHSQTEETDVELLQKLKTEDHEDQCSMPMPAYNKTQGKAKKKLKENPTTFHIDLLNSIPGNTNIYRK